MNKVLLSIHVLAAIMAVGPVAVAASMFPVVALQPDFGAVHLGFLHRVCRICATITIVVPVFGFATASGLHVLGNAWLVTSIGLTTAAALTLVTLVLPHQGTILARPAAATDDRRLPVRLAIETGAFNVLWVAVTVLMIVRPGSTTGV